MIRFSHRVLSLSFAVFVYGLLLSVAWPVSGGETSPESKSDAPAKGKESEAKPKEGGKAPELKGEEAEPKTKELEQKVKELEQRVKDLEPKPKEPEAKKETETKPKGAEPKKETDIQPKEEPKPKEPDVKNKEGKAKEPEQKTKDTEQKAKEPEAKKEIDTKQKDTEPAEPPCPQVHAPTEGKPASDAPVTSDSSTGEKPKSTEADTKRPLRSPMVTAKLALMADARLFPYDIEVDTKDKDLVLLGKVGNETEKRVATDIVRCLEGVHAVENRLKVETDAAHSLLSERDKVITHLVKERFEKSKTLQSVKFDVKTEDGVVTLTGSTRFQVIVLEAAQAARQVPGVKAVNTDQVRLVSGE